MTFELHLFGIPAAYFEGEHIPISRRRAMALLSLLAVEPGTHHREQLALMLWPDEDRSSGLGRLRRVLTSLKQELPEDRLNIERQSIALQPQEGDLIDVQSLRAARQSDDPEAWSKAVALLRGSFMQDFALEDSDLFENWLREQRSRYEVEAAALWKGIMQHNQDKANLEQAIHAAQQWSALDPLQPEAISALLDLYSKALRRVDAIRSYHEYAKRLQEELGLEPDAHLRAKFEAARSATISPNMTAAAPSSVHVLPTRPALVIGREQALAELKKRCGVDNRQEGHALNVMQGWPGVGKSTIVAQLAHDPALEQAFPDGVLWVSLGEKPDIDASLNQWARALGLSDEKSRPQRDKLSIKLKAALSKRRMLLLVDDLWRTEDAQHFAIGGGDCVTLYTTRFNDVARQLAPTPAALYRLPQLSDADALHLLAELTPETVAQHPQEAQALVSEIEGLPLALQVAGRLLYAESRMGWGVRDLLEELRSGTALLEAAAPADRPEWQSDTSPTVAVLLQKSTDYLDEDTRRYFALLALLAPKPATFDLGVMQAIWETEHPRPIVRKLVDRGLLEPSGERFQMHALLVMHARSMFNDTAA